MQISLTQFRFRIKIVLLELMRAINALYMFTVLTGYLDNCKQSISHSFILVISSTQIQQSSLVVTLCVFLREEEIWKEESGFVFVCAREVNLAY